MSVNQFLSSSYIHLLEQKFKLDHAHMQNVQGFTKLVFSLI